MQYGFGVDLGGTTVKIAFFHETGTLLQKWEIPTVTAEGGVQILPDIAASIRKFLDENHIPDADILGIGIGVPGPVDRSGIVNRCQNLGWGVFDVAKAVTTHTGFPAKAGNDATMAALGEYWKGGCKSENMVLITLGTGVGGGIILDGHPLFGANGAAGEIGHIVLNRDEPLACSCGKRGCAEQYCSATGIVRTARQYLQEDPRPSPLRSLETLTCKDIFDAGASGDAVALDILELVYDHLAELVADVCGILDPQQIVIGGGVSKAGAVLLEGIRRHLPKYIFHAMKNVEFRLATLGNDAGAYGAFKLILDATTE